MSKISFIYFDVGGVLIKDYSDSSKWSDMLNFIGARSEEVIKGINEIYNSLEDEICCGKRHVDTLVPIFIEKFGLPISPEFSMQDYFVEHFELNPGIWPIVKDVKKIIKTGLLTDMHPGMLDAIYAHKLINDQSWHAVINSSLVGYRKPMPEIYKIAQEKAGVPAEEIIFIDNRQKNLDGAKQAGWQTYLYNSSNYEKSNSALHALFSQISNK